MRENLWWEPFSRVFSCPDSIAEEAVVIEDSPEFKQAERTFIAIQRELREVHHKARTGQVLPPDEPPLCSFCGAGSNNVQRMLAGHVDNGFRAYICNVCVEAFCTTGADKT